MGVDLLELAELDRHGMLLRVRAGLVPDAIGRLCPRIGCPFLRVLGTSRTGNELGSVVRARVESRAVLRPAGRAVRDGDVGVALGHDQFASPRPVNGSEPRRANDARSDVDHGESISLRPWSVPCRAAAMRPWSTQG